MMKHYNWKHLFLTGSAALTLVWLGACNLPEVDKLTKPQPKEEIPEDKFDFVRRNDAVKYSKEEKKSPDEVGEKSNGQTQDELSKSADKLGVDSRRRPQLPKNPRKAAPYYEDFIILDADEKVPVMLTFNNAPLIDVIPAFADILGFDFTVDPEVKNTVTVNLNSTLTRRELWQAFDDMLKVAGAGVIKNQHLLRIMPSAKIPSQGELRVNNRADGGGEIIFFALHHNTAKETAAQLKPFLSKEAAVIEMTKQNMLLISDNSSNIAKIKQILEMLDQPGRHNWPRLVICCNNVKPSKIVSELSEILPVIGLPVVLATDKTEQPGAIQLAGVDRLQIIAASAATPEALKEIQQWVHILDNASSSDQERVYVYKVAHSKADQLVQALSVIFATQGTTLTIDTTSGNNRTTQITAQTTRNPAIVNAVNTAATAANRNSTNNQLNTQIDRDSSIFDTPVRVFADGIYNRLVVRTTPRTYAMIKALLDRLDLVPAQVLLQILVVEVTLTDSNQFGLEFSNTTGSGNVGSMVGTNYANLNPDKTTDEGFKFAIFNPKNPEEKFGYIKALAGRNKLKVISSPQLIVTSNSEAKIQVGNSVPILTQDSTSTNITNNIVRSYTYKDTGIIMTITPQITSTDLISLQLKQEVSDAIANTITTATETPVISQRVLETVMTIANGRTMIIGGMIQEKSSDKLQSIPFLADIPWISRLIGNTEASIQRTEMLVLVTGYIVHEKNVVEDMIKRYNDAVKALSTFENDIIKQDETDRKLGTNNKAMRERDAKAAATGTN